MMKDSTFVREQKKRYNVTTDIAMIRQNAIRARLKRHKKMLDKRNAIK